MYSFVYINLTYYLLLNSLNVCIESLMFKVCILNQDQTCLGLGQTSTLTYNYKHNKLFFDAYSLYHPDSMRWQNVSTPQLRLVDVTIRAALLYNKEETLIGSQTNFEITTKYGNATLLQSNVKLIVIQE